MPPLPSNGTSYPPSSSGYQPLHLDADEPGDLESSYASTSSQWVQQRLFSHSPYRSQANDPSHLLQTFLSDTRPHTAQQKQLHLRISVRYRDSTAKHVELHLPELTTQDSLPFALADDVPCLRGLPASGAVSWKGRLRGLAEQLGGSSSSRINNPALQVWNGSQSKPLYASDEEIKRYHERLKSTTLPPWTPLNDDFLPAESNSPSNQAENTDEQVDRLFTASGSLSDFDLSSVFQRTRQRKTSRLVSSGLQEAMERFADDRHFSKRLVTKQCVWGWNMAELKRRVREVVTQEGAAGKGKSREQHVTMDNVQVDIEVVGLDSAPVYHVVWAPIVYLSSRCRMLCDSRAALLGLVGASVLIVTAVLLGMLTNTLAVIIALLTIWAWSTLMWLVRTQHECVYDNVGTAWPLAPRWVKIADADPGWDHDTVVQTLGGSGTGVKVGRQKEAWFVKRGMDAQEWLELHRERLIHALKL